MVSRFTDKFAFFIKEPQNRQRLKEITSQVAERENLGGEQRPVVFFNASTRLDNISLNAAFSSLTAWGFRLSGIPVVHFVCQAGMSRCVLGSDPDDYTKKPPCAACISQSRRLNNRANVQWLSYVEHAELAAALDGLKVEELIGFDFQDQPLGQIVLPSIRWRMRRHHLRDDEGTRFLYQEFILSAYRVGQEFGALLDRVDPFVAIIFNGMMFPEAMARREAQVRGIPVVTHEIGYQPFTGFFTTGDATERLVHLPNSYELTVEQNSQLDAYLGKRFRGQFSMGGIQFWQGMSGLEEGFLEKMSQYEQVVPVFTNVIFDTSQPHANVVFEHMFAWLDVILEIIKVNPETLFVIRAHPDEMRPDSKKQSRETVRQWVQENRVAELSNVIFIDSLEYSSSYDLIQRSKFVMVYNSSIGLEGTLLGAAVISGGEAWYTHYPTVFFPQTPQAFRGQVEGFLGAEKIEIPEEFQYNARRLVYYQNFSAALPFGEYLANHGRRGYVMFKSFPVEQLKPENSPAVQAIQNGIINKHKVFAHDEVA